MSKLTKLGDYCDRLEKHIAKLEEMNRDLKLKVIDLKRKIANLERELENSAKVSYTKMVGLRR